MPFKPLAMLTAVLLATLLALAACGGRETGPTTRAESPAGLPSAEATVQGAAPDVLLSDAVLDCQQAAFLTGRPDCWGALVRDRGPEVVLKAMGELLLSGAIDPATDTHHLAHVIGRQTAASFGLNGEAFLRCPTDFNYGCQHGFFEQALASSPDATQAASLICSGLAASHPSKTVFYCYHGVGHGVMMASAYDLDQALSTCDALADPAASDGCWQGVFMENVNAVMRGEAREGVFSDQDPLAPCNRVDERHQWECYINHAGRLITFFDFSVKKAAEACLAAESRYVSACIQSLGLMVSNPAWQTTLAGPGSEARNVEVALELCGQFPRDYRQDCVVGAVDNILNFDGTVLDRALSLCRAAEEGYRGPCYRRIGSAIGAQVLDLRQRRSLCQQVEGDYRGLCLEGAGVADRGGEPEATQAASARGEPYADLPTLEAGPTDASPGDTEKKADAEVRYAGGAFSPASVTIAVGQTVRWANEDSEAMWPASDLHPTHQQYPGFDARRPIPRGGSWAFTFRQSGTWTYHNHMDPRAGGTVVVE